jgi:hypothetical protein
MELAAGAGLALVSVPAGGAGVSCAEVVWLAVLGIVDVGGVEVLVAGADAGVGVVLYPHPTVMVTSAATNAVVKWLRAGISVV